MRDWREVHKRQQFCKILGDNITCHLNILNTICHYVTSFKFYKKFLNDSNYHVLKSLHTAPSLFQGFPGHKSVLKTKSIIQETITKICNDAS